MATFRFLASLLLAIGALAARKSEPVSQVITALQEMLQDLESDQKGDEETYDKIACWCEESEKKTTQAIADSEAHITLLNSEIEEFAATTARLAAEMRNLEEELKSDEDALAEATALRKQQNDGFNAQNKDLVESVTALKAAISVLSKHHQSLVQLPPSPQHRGVALTLQRELTHHAAQLQGRLTPSQRRAAVAFVQAHFGREPGYLSATPVFKGAYAPQSGDIFGIMQQMLEDFEEDLQDAQQEETKAQSDYENLKAAKSKEIATAEQQLETKTRERAESAVMLAHSKVDLKDTKVALSDDEAVLMDLKEGCQATDTEWELRQKRRQEELAAVSKALEILSSDEAQGVFNRTWKPSVFLQLHTNEHSAKRVKVSAILSHIAAKLSDPKLSVLATKVKLDAFDEVKKAIDEMVVELLKEKDDEIKKRDYCIGELHGNEVHAEKTEREKEDTTTKIAALDVAIGQLSSAVDVLKVEISNLEAELNAAGEERRTQNQKFQKTVADQQSTQRILRDAKDFLLSYYGKGSTAAVSLAQSQTLAPTTPEGFDKYESSEAAPTVIALIETIINEAQQLQSDAEHAETEAQQEYERFVKDTDASINDKSTAVAHKSVSKADAEKQKSQAEDERDALNEDLQRLAAYATDMNLECEFILKNFEVRQTARDEEVQALRDAKSILSGSAS